MRRWLIVLAVSASGVSSAQAQILLGSCTVLVGQQGKLGINASGNELSSTASSGRNALATVRTDYGILNGLTCGLGLLCFSVSAPPPLAFGQAPVGAVSLSFETNYRTNGGSPKPGGTPTALRAGTYSVELDFKSKSLAGPFPAGDYRGDVLIRCE